MERRLDITPAPAAQVLRLERELEVPGAVAQVLVRRGLGDPVDARAWLAADVRHPVSAFSGIAAVAERILGHVGRASRITVHGDYDVDGVCSTAILVRVLRHLGADVDWYLPSRTEDGYGLAAATVRRLAQRGTGLLVTVDCAVTAVEEVALARELGVDVVVTDHHSARADGVLPDAPIVHPGLNGHPCPELCAAGVAHALAQALLEAAGGDIGFAREDLDLVALATVADCVALTGENRRLVREGLLALARTTKPGLRALMRVARVDPARVDATAIGFRLAPRINAAGRVARADSALELLLTEDPDRAAAIAEELDRANGERRFVEQRILFAAEAQVAEQGEQPAYVLAGEDWHPGVIGIVASRIAERHHRPAVLIALDGEQGTGSGRSIPGFDLLAGLHAASEHLQRHGGHRAAAGCTVHRDDVEAFRQAFRAHAAATLRPDDLVRRQRVDAVVGGDDLGLELADSIAALGPFGMGNPSVMLLVPGARLCDPRPMGEGRHLRLTVESGGVRARAVAFGMSQLESGEEPVNAVFELERNEFNGAVEPRLLLRCTTPVAADAPVVLGEALPGSGEWAAAVLAAVQPSGRPLAADRAVPSRREPCDRRGSGLAGVLGALVHGGEDVCVVVADAPARQRHLTGLVAGLTVCSWDALERDPALASGATHLVALDPPPTPGSLGLLEPGPREGQAVLAWGAAELRYAEDVLERDLALRPLVTALYRGIRDGGLAGVRESLGHLPEPVVGRALCVLAELGLVSLDAGDVAVRPADGGRTALERSATFVAAARRHQEMRAWLTSANRRVAA